MKPKIKRHLATGLTCPRSEGGLMHYTLCGYVMFDKEARENERDGKVGEVCEVCWHEAARKIKERTAT